MRHPERRRLRFVDGIPEKSFLIFFFFFFPSTVIIVDEDISGLPPLRRVMHSLGINFGDKIDAYPVVTMVTLNVHTVSLVILE